MLLSANAATSKAQTVKPESNTMLNPKLREIIATDTRRFLPYDRYGEPLPGMSWLPLSGEAQNGEFECFLLRMEAGARSRPHEHTGFEEFLVIDGELVDCDGKVFRGGDFVRFLPGSKHSSHTPEGCTILVMLRGNNRALDAIEI
jgi:anti-sigma factor ChrR (cupin superfamily)